MTTALKIHKWLFNKTFSLNVWSIKKLTILGFIFVALPLVLVLLYSATKLNKLAFDSEMAINNAAYITQQLDSVQNSLIKLERKANQAVILEDHELIAQFDTDKKKLMTLFSNRQNTLFNDEYQRQLNLIIKAIGLIEVTQNRPSYTSKQQLAHLKIVFNQINSQINNLMTIGNNLIVEQSSFIKNTASSVEKNLLTSLWVIPITTFIAAFFVFAITRPLKLLAKHIRKIESGNFEHSINVNGSAEVIEIADALELMRNRLHVLELQKSSFIRHISHELKTPLAAIKEGTELIYDHSVGELNPEQQEISHIIRENATKLQSLIEGLLNFNIVLDSTSLQTVKELDINEMVNQGILDQQLEIKRQQITIVKNIEQKNILGNLKQLSVIFDNLLSNALKHSPLQGKIFITTRNVNEQLVFTVTDEGCGIADNIKSKIFDAFYQGPTAVEQTIKSSGLGLTIVKELIMRMQGSIEVKDNIPTGTTVILNLPLSLQIKPQASPLLSKNLKVTS